jgi:hypothetical protein
MLAEEKQRSQSKKKEIPNGLLPCDNPFSAERHPNLPPRGTPMRFITPSALLFALVMLVLPWIEIRCDAGPPLGSITVIEQNGIQTMTGQYSLGSSAKGKANVNPSDKLDPALFVIGWAVLAALGVIIGLVVPMGASRTFLLGVCSLAAVACLVVQGFVVKFPVVLRMEKDKAEKKDLGPALQLGPNLNNMGGLQPNIPGGLKPNIPQPEAKAVLVLGFWLALAATAAACAGVVVEASVGKKPSRAAGGGEGAEDEGGGAPYRY